MQSTALVRASVCGVLLDDSFQRECERLKKWLVKLDGLGAPENSVNVFANVRNVVMNGLVQRVSFLPVVEVLLYFLHEIALGALSLRYRLFERRSADGAGNVVHQPFCGRGLSGRIKALLGHRDKTVPAYMGEREHARLGD